MPQSLVNAIYNRYSEISSSDLEAPIATAPILADNNNNNRSCTNMCTVNCSDYLSSSSSSSSFPSPGSLSSPSSPPQAISNDSSNSSNANYSPSGISFYIPPAYSPRKTRK